MRLTSSFASAGAMNKCSSAVLPSTTYPADQTLTVNKTYSQLLYLTPAAVPGWTFFKHPAERKAANRYKPFHDNP